MEENVFHSTADKLLSEIAESIEEADNKGLLEVDFLNGILNIEVPGAKQYIINKHGPSKEIWMSSPFSGAHHFACKDGGWISSKGIKFPDILMEELIKNAGLKIAGLEII